MLWMHPALQMAATLIALYAAWLGGDRLLAQLLKIKRVFLWNRHVLVGKIAVALWFMGLVGGFSIAKLTWGVMYVTGPHAQTALVMLGLMLVSATTGIYMDRNRRRRTVLPLIHGTTNIVLLGLAFLQVRTGWQVIQDFIL